MTRGAGLADGTVTMRARPTRVKLLGNFCTPEELCRQWDRMSQGGLRWNDIQVTWEDDDVDFYVIINSPRPGDHYVPGRTIVFQMEPWCGESYQTWGVKTWGEWATPDPARFLQVRTHRTHLNNAFWQMKATWDELRRQPVAKTRVLASICSPKYFDPGHVRRVDFLKFLERKDDDVVRVDVYAHDNPLGFRSWVGPHPPGEKDAALLPYRYFFAAENNREHNFVTEKLWEPLLAESLCFYWGAPNAADWIDPRAFIPVDLDDFEQAFATMKSAILGNEWEKRIDVIRREKRKVLDHHQFFPTLERILHRELRLAAGSTDAEVLHHKYFADTLDAPMRTVCFVHALTRGTDTSILEEILAEVEASGLLERLDRLVVVNVGDEAVLSARWDRHADRIRLIHYSRDASRAEAPTLELLRNFASFHEDARILYLHTKGASHAFAHPNVADWRRMMLHFLVERHEEALAALAKHDVVGCNLRDDPWPHFSGNFWWAHARYLKTLPAVPHHDRLEAEWWVLGGSAVRAANLHDSGIDHYREPYPRSRYATGGDGARTEDGGRIVAPAAPSVDAAAAPSPSICLVLVVRDAARVIAEGLASIVPHVVDYVVVDTGSSDGTQEVIRAFFAAAGIPGHLLERPWRDPGESRTEALALARERSASDYLWLFDAGDRVDGRPEFGSLAGDAGHLRFGGEIETWRLRIFRRSRPWRFVGAMGEHPACDAPDLSLDYVPGGYRILARRPDRGIRARPGYERDLARLEAALAAEPRNPRRAFDLAQGLFEARQFDRALDAFRHRAAMDGWAEETYCARYRAAACLERLDRPGDDVLAAYTECHREHPHRAEPLVRAAALARAAGRHAEAYVFAKRAARIAAPPAGALLVEADDYEYRALDEQAMAAFYCDFPEESFDLCAQLLDERQLPDRERVRIEHNRDFSVLRLKDAYLRYDPRLVAGVAARPASPQPQVTLAITSCRRLELFVGTVCSFLAACTDIERVDRFLCVDDNSPAEDRAQMQRLFPFFEFIWKGPDEKGHARSLNLIRDAVRTPWLVHLEDDWHFFARRDYIGAAIEILEERPDLGQVLFNRNYAETLDDRELPGGFVHRTGARGRRYVAHEHHALESDAHRAFLARHPRRSNAWWPHYSLRPGVVRTSVFARVGPYDETATHFELDYARRYLGAGYRTAFLDGVFALHTGRLTSERNDASRPNAYELNGVEQFGTSPRMDGAEDTRDTAGGQRQRDPVGAPDLAQQLEIRVINLDRRPDRLASFRARLEAAASAAFVPRVRRHRAVDGRRLALTPDVRHTFRGNDFAYRRGFVGCALSHLALWRELAAGTAPAMLVFEDDAAPCRDFDTQLAQLCATLEERHPAFDLVFLGFIDWHPRPEDDFETAPGPVRVQRFEGTRYLGGLYAYLVSRRGARRLLGIVERDGIQNGIDRFVHRKEAELELLVVTPHLAKSPLVPPGSGLDSDIQNDFQSLSDDDDRRSS